MSIVKTFAKAVYNFAFTKTERITLTKAEMQSNDKLHLIAEFLGNASNLKDSELNRKLVKLTEDYVVTAHGANSFPQMCRSHVRNNSNNNYYITAALGRILEGHAPFNTTPVSGGEASELIEGINEALGLASMETNLLKRRAHIRNAVKEKVEGLTGAKLDFVVDAIILMCF